MNCNTTFGFIWAPIIACSRLGQWTRTLTAAIALAVGSASAQTGGTVNFGNHSSSLVTNAQTALPVTAADNVRAALYWGALGSSTFMQLGASVAVGTPLPGLFVGGTRTSGPATAGGSNGLFQVRAWGGGYATYEEALLREGVLIGQSALITSQTGDPLGSPPSAPVSLLAGGFQGFTLTTNISFAGPPRITCPAPRIVECGSTWTFETPIAVDGCTSNSLPVYVVSTVTNGQGPQFITQTWVATNSCDTSYVFCCQVVVVVDTTPPALTCAPDKTVQSGTAWDFDLPAASDTCSGTNVTVAVALTTTNGIWPQVIKRWWLATDACGNTNSCSQVVTVLNTSVPVLICASNKAVNCDTNWSFDLPEAFDPGTGTNLPVWVVDSVSSNMGPCTQFLTRTWVATNACNTNAATCSQTVTVTCSNCPMIVVTKQCPPNPVPPGGTLTFTGAVTNAGNVTLTDVLVVNDQPAPNTLVYGPATLEPGGGAAFSASYRVPPCSCGPFIDTLTATGTSIYGGVVTSFATTTCPGTNAYALAGDLNGDGIVDQDELNAVLANYWASSRWLYMSNPVTLGGGFFQFALTNATGWNFTVLASSDGLDWTNLPGPAYPVYQFNDPAAAGRAPVRLYRLRWP